MPAATDSDVPRRQTSLRLDVPDRIIFALIMGRHRQVHPSATFNGVFRWMIREIARRLKVLPPVAALKQTVEQLTEAPTDAALKQAIHQLTDEEK